MRWEVVCGSRQSSSAENLWQRLDLRGQGFPLERGMWQEFQTPEKYGEQESKVRNEAKVQMYCIGNIRWRSVEAHTLPRIKQQSRVRAVRQIQSLSAKAWPAETQLALLRAWMAWM